METNFEKITFKKRLKTMLKVDFRRMFTMPLIYIMAGVDFVIPILILVMTSTMGNGDSQPEAEVFANVWQAIGSISGNIDMSMGLTTMCNMNLMYFLIAVLVCVFTAEDFKSGYVKNLFAIRSKKIDYVFSKTLVCFIGGVIIILMYFIGATLGGAIAGLSFTMDGFNAYNLVACLISKLFLVMVFVAIFLTFSIIAKQKAWLSILLSFGVGALLFMMIPIMTPLNASILNVIMCIAGGCLLAIGFGALSNVVLNKISLL